MLVALALGRRNSACARGIDMIPRSGIRELAMGLVIEFGASPSGVDVFPKILGQGHPIVVLWHIPKPIQVAVNTGRRRAKSHHDCGTGRAAERRSAMGLFKKHATFGEGIDVWCLGLRMAAETADPVIEVVHGNEQYIGALFGEQAMRKLQKY